MGPDRNVLFALHTLKQGFIDADELVDCLDRWARGREGSLREIVVAAAELSPEEVEELDSRLPPSGATRAPSELLEDLEEGEGEGVPDLALPDGDMDLEDFDLDPDAPPAEDRPTKRIASTAVRFLLGEEIGKGGLGRVLGAIDRVLGRKVAVKEMIRGTDHPGMLQRFLREGEVAGRLLHPNIVPVFDVGVREGKGGKIPYFVMGRIEGRDLSEILHEGEAGDAGFSRARLLGIFQDVCLAIAYAHDQGVVHRDLKPANVMVGNYGEVYVVDWGLAKVQGASEDILETEPLSEGSETESGSTALTEAGQVLGTPSYMAPEQARGTVEEIDERSDVYALGAILYEILTFHPPFEGPSKINIIAQVMKERPMPPSEKVSVIRTAASLAEGSDTIIVPRSGDEEILSRTFGAARGIPDTVPAELEEIVLKAMAREKE
ncbi:MAG: serine/threonine-protein kinase, partial [Planctomycetota bacterium]